jgi:hypothetical protein
MTSGVLESRRPAHPVGMRAIGQNRKPDVYLYGGSYHLTAVIERLPDCYVLKGAIDSSRDSVESLRTG